MTDFVNLNKSSVGKLVNIAYVGFKIKSVDKKLLVLALFWACWGMHIWFSDVCFPFPMIQKIITNYQTFSSHILF